MPLSWGEDLSALQPPFDFVFAAECLYMGRVAPLLQTLHAASSSATKVLVCGIVGDGTVDSYLSLVEPLFESTTVPQVRVGEKVINYIHFSCFALCCSLPIR